MEKIPFVPPMIERPPEELERRLRRGMELLGPLLWDLLERRRQRENADANG